MDSNPQVPLSMGFPRQEYWHGLPFPSPVDLPDPGIKPGSPARKILYHWATREALTLNQILTDPNSPIHELLLPTLLEKTSWLRVQYVEGKFCKENLGCCYQVEDSKQNQKYSLHSIPWLFNSYVLFSSHKFFKVYDQHSQKHLTKPKKRLLAVPFPTSTSFRARVLR